MTLAEYARKNMFVPLGMKNTHFHDDVTTIVKNRATGYGRRKNGQWIIDETTLEIVGDGGIFTTIEDMYLWDQNFYKNRLGKGGSNLIEKMQTRGILNNGESTDYGLGLAVWTYQGKSLISHTGGWVGFSSNYMRFPDQQFTVIVFCNLNLGTIDPGLLAKKVAEIWIGEKPVAVDPTILERYVGTYQFGPEIGSIVSTVGINKGELFIGFTGMSTVKFLPRSETEWYNNVEEATVTFKVDGEGKCSEMEFFQRGVRLKAKRIE